MTAIAPAAQEIPTFPCAPMIDVSFPQTLPVFLSKVWVFKDIIPSSEATLKRVEVWMNKQGEITRVSLEFFKFGAQKADILKKMNGVGIGPSRVTEARIAYETNDPQKMAKLIEIFDKNVTFIARSKKEIEEVKRALKSSLSPSKL